MATEHDLRTCRKQIQLLREANCEIHKKIERLQQSESKSTIKNCLPSPTALQKSASKSLRVKSKDSKR
jgi:DNA-binding transcriptional MerR regulator